MKKRVKGDFKLGMVSLVAEGQTHLQAFLLLSKEMAFKKTKSPATINKKNKKQLAEEPTLNPKKKISEICLQLFYGKLAKHQR